MLHSGRSDRAVVHRLDRPGGSALNVRVLGEGPPVVLLNALGQDVAPCLPLARFLALRRTVYLWAPRGIGADEGTADFEAQVDDVLAVLDEFGVRRCGVVGWCTGPKTALEVIHRRPGAVTATVFLNGSFKRLGEHAEQDTPYERNMEAIARLLERDRNLAGRAAGLLAGDPADSGTPVPAELREAVRRPFRTEATLIRYTGQLMDFWSRDVPPPPAATAPPTLCVGTEHDAVASVPRFQAAARALPGAHWMRVPGAGHYYLHERPDLVGDLAERFLGER